MEDGEGGPCKGDLQMLHNPIDKDEEVSQAASSSPHSRPNGDREGLASLMLGFLSAMRCVW